MKFFRSLSILLLPALVVAASAVAAENADPKAPPASPRTTGLAELFGDPVIARGQGVEIKRSQLEDAFTAWKANLAARGQGIGEDQRPMREYQLLDKLIVTQLMNNRATAGDKTVAKGQADKFMADSKKDSASESAFNGQLNAMGLSPEQFKKRVLEQAMAEAVLEREVKSKLEISTNQIQDFYNTGTDAVVRIMQQELERLAKDPNTSVTQLTAVKQQIEELKRGNLARLEQPEKVRVSHILIATRDLQTEAEMNADQKKAKHQQAEKLLARARAGEDFSKLVLEFSQDRNLKETKGEYTLSRQDLFVPEFKAAAFSLATNQISDIVTTTFGYHIIKCLEKIPARKIEFAKISGEIKEALLNQELQQQMPAYFERLKKEARVEILDPKYKLESPKSLESPKTAAQ
jgi:parvulin-like peptidyl-prolyl isomerase